MTKNQILNQTKKDKVKSINLQFTDILGLCKNVTIPIHKLEDAIDSGVWFDGSSIQGFTRIAESDMFLRLDLSTYGVMPWLKTEDGYNTARFICDVYRPDGEPFDGDPRYILKKVVKEAKDRGFIYNTGPELEFFLFKKENGIVRPLPHDKGGYFDLSMDLAYRLREEMVKNLEVLGIEVETSHHEVAVGQHEIDFKYDNAVATADKAVTLKYVLKAIAQKYNLHATFMPKPIKGINGSGMHVHQSLFDIKKKKNAFFSKDDKYKLSKIAYHFIAGQLAHAKGMSAILSPTVNSYKRLVPGYEAPCYISWARINRSALIRVPEYTRGKEEATRAELRCPDPSCNPYLAFAVMLKAGLDGIKKKMKPPKPIEEDIFEFDSKKLEEYKIETLPYSLWQAIENFKKDKVVQEVLGKHLFEQYIEAKTEEWDLFRLHVTDWEVDRYLEVY